MGWCVSNVPLENVFDPGASASRFCEWFQVGIDAHIPCRKYQIKCIPVIHWFPVSRTAAIAHRNHFFRSCH